MKQKHPLQTGVISILKYGVYSMMNFNFLLNLQRVDKTTVLLETTRNTGYLGFVPFITCCL